ncbi:MAG: hypothetical protein HWN67_03740 [Candidatus Helarchaeota archaeon]|nr:hypothetical protein [Candidatus Helarchaeota archaeon]
MPNPSESLDIFYAIQWVLTGRRNNIEPFQIVLIVGIICCAVIAVILAWKIKKSSSKT